MRINTEEYVRYSITHLTGVLNSHNFDNMDLCLIEKLTEFLYKIKGLDTIKIQNGSGVKPKLFNGTLKGKQDLVLEYKGLKFGEKGYKHSVCYKDDIEILSTVELNKLLDLSNNKLKNQHKKFRDSIMLDLKEVIYMFNCNIDNSNLYPTITLDNIKSLAYYYNLDNLFIDTKFIIEYLNSNYGVSHILGEFIVGVLNNRLPKVTELHNYLLGLKDSSLSKEVVKSYTDTLLQKNINVEFQIDNYLIELFKRLDTNPDKEMALSQVVQLKCLIGNSLKDLGYILDNIIGTRLYSSNYNGRLLSQLEIDRGVTGFSKTIKLIKQERIGIISKLGCVLRNKSMGVIKVEYSLDFLTQLVTELQDLSINTLINDCLNDISVYDYPKEVEEVIEVTENYLETLKETKIKYVSTSKIKQLLKETDFKLSVLGNHISTEELSVFYVGIGKKIVGQHKDFNNLSSKQKGVLHKLSSFVSDSVILQCRVLNLYRSLLVNRKVGWYEKGLAIVDKVLRDCSYTSKQGSVITSFYLEAVDNIKEFAKTNVPIVSTTTTETTEPTKPIEPIKDTSTNNKGEITESIEMNFDIEDVYNIL